MNPTGTALIVFTCVFSSAMAGMFLRASLDAPEAVTMDQEIEARILGLTPQTEIQRWLRSEALRVGGEIAETRLIVVSSLERSVPMPFLVVVVFWLTIIFGNFGLFAPLRYALLRLGP